MLFQEFVEQHRIHCFVADGERLAPFVVRFNFESDDAALSDATGDKPVQIIVGYYNLDTSKVEWKDK